MPQSPITLSDFIQQATESDVHLGSRFIGSGGNLFADGGHAILADLGQVAGLRHKVGFGRNVQLIDSPSDTAGARRLRGRYPMWRIERLRGVNVARTINVHR